METSLGEYKSPDGLNWDEHFDFSLPSTKVGEFWWTQPSLLSRNIYISTDQTQWIRTRTSWIPDVHDDGMYAFLDRILLTRGSRFQPSEEEPIFGVSVNGIDWTVFTPDRDVRRLLGRLAGQWVGNAVRSSIETSSIIYRSQDGQAWYPLDWPGAGESWSDFRLFFGEGVLFFVGQKAPDSSYVGLSTVDLDTWVTADLTGLDVSELFFTTNDGVIEKVDGAYRMGRRRVSQTFPQTIFFKHAYTTDFKTFTAREPENDPDKYPQSASDSKSPGTSIEILNEFKLKLSLPGGAVQYYEDSSELNRQFITGVAKFSGRWFVSTHNKVYSRPVDGADWTEELSLPGDLLGKISFNKYAYSGFHSPTVWNDSVWVAANPVDIPSQTPLQGGLWRWDSNQAAWQQERNLPSSECTYFGKAGDALYMAGFRYGDPFIDYSTDGINWESHAIPVQADRFRIRFSKDRFWLLSYSYDDPTDLRTLIGSRVHFTYDLKTWHLALESDENSFRDVASVSGDFIVSQGPFIEPGMALFSPEGADSLWRSSDGLTWDEVVTFPIQGSGRFLELPDGSILDYWGYLSKNGRHWETLNSYGHPTNGFLSVTPEGIARINNYFATPDSVKYTHLQLFSVVEDPLPFRSWTFFPGELASLDKAIQTDWGRFQPVGDNWYFHNALGYLFVMDNTLASNWFYGPDLGWLWLDPSYMPIAPVYDPADSTWEYVRFESNGQFLSTEIARQLIPGQNGYLPVGDGLPLVFVPAGEYLMGAHIRDFQAHPDEYPLHKEVVASSFFIAATETTLGAFADVMGYLPSLDYLPDANPRRPAVNVTREEAMDFCRLLTLRGHSEGWLPEEFIVTLPTEIEWEYAACRIIEGRSSRPYPWDDYRSNLYQYANFWQFDESQKSVPYNFPSPEALLPVGTYPPIAEDYPIYDMLGNAWEWCLNDYYLYDPQGDYPQGSHDAVANGYQTARGGGWWSDDSDLRTCNRTALEPGYKSADVGFRIVIRKSASQH